ncbi:ATP-binding protein [Alteribacillus sp. HJP-4]|uniref:ATP-binding protein n=1 Tax=Alteribacillus sp. HJP-4 TaxID=2775394 RepID=UPI0035CCDFF6
MNNAKEETDQLALQSVRSLALISASEEPFETDGVDEIQLITESLKDQIDATDIMISDKQGEIVAHSSNNKIGSRLKGDDTYTALVFGGTYTKRIHEDGSEFVRGYSPIYIDYGDYFKLEGVATVSFSLNEMRQDVWFQILQVITITFIVFLIGAAGAIWVSKSIRNDTLGLEPYQISNLYTERDAILQSIKEGLIAFDQEQKITMINQTAKDLFQIEQNTDNKYANDILPENILNAFISNSPLSNEEITYKEKSLIFSRTPVIEKGKASGAVVTFRDKTEIKQMLNAFSEVKSYSEDLRAQTHEFTNKLYVLLGLIQLGLYEEAEDMIQAESNAHQSKAKVLFNQLHDDKLQAILLGKTGIASERKIDFTIKEDSYLNSMPPHISLSQLIVIVGNLIDNAFEALKDQNVKIVSFFITDLGDDIVMEIEDNGPGIPEDITKQIFERGFSSKGAGRGYGLFNVMNEINELQGNFEWHHKKEGGTIMTVYLPKENGGFFDD